MLEADINLQERALEALQGSLPPGWTVAAGQEGREPEGTVVGPDGARGRLAILPMPALSPRAARILALEVKQAPASAPTVVVAPYLSSATREKLTEAGLGYLDLTGNARIVLTRPGLFIQTQGAQRDPNPKRRASRSIVGDKAGRIVRTLIESRQPPGVRELAERTGTDPGYVSRIVALLDREALVDRDRRGRIASVEWRGLLERWAVEVPLDRRGVSTACLAARGLDDLLARAVEASESIAWTGSLAVADLAPVAPTRLAVAYVTDLEGAMEELDLRVTERGANALLITPSDGWVFERTRSVDGLRAVAVSQAAADLLSSPGRGPAEGEALLDWMEANEEAWRV